MKTLLTVAALTLVAGVAMCAWQYRTITIAYRLTLEVLVDGETHIGTGVIGAYWGRNVVPLTTEVLASSVRGEAVTVDLGRYGPLFLVLWGKYQPANLPHAVYYPPDQHLSQDYWDQLLELTRPKPPREIPHDALPLLVRFRDVNQPSTADCVDPDNMQASYSPGAQVTLVHATIEIVNEPVTTGAIEKWLPWLALPRFEMERLLTDSPVWLWRPHWGKKVCLLSPSFLESSK
jgi:hypothetical protein